jgi:hypothetical protein
MVEAGNERAENERRRGRIGFSDHELDTFPIVDFNKADSIMPEDARCAICLDDYEERDKLRQFACTHHFHQTCVDRWLRRNRHCPLCQQSLDNAKDVRGSSMLPIHSASASREEELAPLGSSVAINVAGQSEA